jgi:hypothetical protein
MASDFPYASRLWRYIDRCFRLGGPDGESIASDLPDALFALDATIAARDPALLAPGPIASGSSYVTAQRGSFGAPSSRWKAARLRLASGRPNVSGPSPRSGASP